MTAAGREDGGAADAGAGRGGPSAGRDPGAARRGDDPAERILPRAEAVERYGRPRDVRVVFTNGCFDLLHRGHAAYLASAAALGDRLVVGLNSDASVRRLKGPGRPVTPAEDRAYLLASLRAVDAVTVFDEDTPLRLIRALVPDVLVKGGDYPPEEVVGREIVEEAGGELRLLPLEEGRSTTGLIRRIRAGGEDEAPGPDAPGAER